MECSYLQQIAVYRMKLSTVDSSVKNNPIYSYQLQIASFYILLSPVQLHDINCYLLQIASLYILLSTVDSFILYTAIFCRQLHSIYCYLLQIASFHILLSIVDSFILYTAIYFRQLHSIYCYLLQIASFYILLSIIYRSKVSQMVMQSHKTRNQYHFKEHTFCLNSKFILPLFEIQPFVYQTIRGFSEILIL